MVRTYARKTQKGAGFSYTMEDLEKALDDIRNGIRTTRGASTFYKIPRSTLKHRIRGTRGSGLTSREGKGGGGVESYLTSVEENEIAECLKIMEKNGFGLSKEEVLDLVQIYLKKNNIETRFKDQRPGNDWFLSFKNRHRLSIKKPQSIEHVRCDQVNPWVVYNFFDVLEKTVKDLDLKGKPGRIFNCDETSFCHDPSKTKVVGAVGTKSTRKTSSSGRENTSVLLCCSGDGKMIPLLCVFKGKYVMENWLNDDSPTQTALSTTSRGWMETTLFYNWFRDVFLPNIPEERPVLLIYDGHTTHVSTDLIRLALNNEVTIMKLPPHTTHLLQPLDVAVFKSLKTNWDKALSKWQRENPRKKIPKQDFVKIITNLAQEIPNLNIVNGFKATGIYDADKKGPNREAIPVSVFKADDLARYKKNRQRSETSTPLTTIQPETCPPLDPVQLEAIPPSRAVQPEACSSSAPVELEASLSSTTVQPETCYTSDSVQMEASTSSVAVQPLPCSASENTQPEVNSSLAVVHPEEESTPTLQGRKSFEELLLEMMKIEKKPENPERKRKRLVKNCEIITTQEYLLKKEQEEKEKKEEEERKKLNMTKKREKSTVITKRKLLNKVFKIKKKRVFDFESDSSDGLDLKDIVEEHERTLEDEKKIEMICNGEQSFDNFSKLKKIVKKVGEYVIFKYEGEYFPGKILSLSNNEVEISAMQKSLKSWKWPDKADIGKYDWEDVIGAIEEPKIISKRGFYRIKELEYLWDI